MPRRPNWPPSILFHKPTNRDRIRWKGKDYWLGPAGSKQARDRYAEVLAELTADRPAECRRLTVEELAAWWSAHALKIYTPESEEPRKFVQAVAVLREVCGADVAATLTPKKLKAVRDAMLKRWSRTLANRHLVRVKTMIRLACEEEVLPPEVYQRVVCVRGVRKGTPGARETTPRQPAQEADLLRVIAEVDAAVGAMLLLMWHSGARPGEMRVLRTTDVEQRSPTLWIFRPYKHKGTWRGNERVIAFGPKAIDVLRPWLSPNEPESFCFTTARGRQWTVTGLCHVIEEGYQRAGVKMTAYQLRHAFKARALREGGISAAMAALGQKSSEAFDCYDQSGDFGAATELARKIG